jgi:hypothetical protein
MAMGRKKKFAAVAVAVAAAAIAAVLYMKGPPTSLLPGHETPPEVPPNWEEYQPPSVPEGHVAFRFFCTFTYVKDGKDFPLSQILSWPGIVYENRDPGVLTQVQFEMPTPRIRREPWSTDIGIIQTWDTIQFDELTVTKDGKKIENYEYYFDKTDPFMGNYKVYIFIDNLAAGESVTLAGTFHVPLKDAENVTYLSPISPELSHIIPPSLEVDLHSGAGYALIPISLRARLERWDGTRWVIVEKYSRDYRERANAPLDAFLENLS